VTARYGIVSDIEVEAPEKELEEATEDDKGEERARPRNCEPSYFIALLHRSMRSYGLNR